MILGLGDGNFGLPLGPFGTGGSGVFRIAAGDFDGNGRDDIVAAPGAPSAGAPTVATLLSNANGTLAAPVARVVPGTPVDPRVADVNGDGRSDVVVTSPSTDAASVLLAAANGSLGAPVNLPVARGGSAALGDMNADGHPDVVVAGNPAGIAVFLGRGDGTFGAGVPVASAGPFSTALAGDLNGDGFADLVLGRSGAGRVIVGLNAPSALPDAGSLVLPTTGVGATSATRSVSIANDGRPPLHITGTGLGGANPGEFVIVGDGCGGLTLPAGARCTVTVAMRPGAAGVRSADLAIASDSAEGVAHVALAGTGVAPPPAAGDVTAPLVGVTGPRAAPAHRPAPRAAGDRLVHRAVHRRRPSRPLPRARAPLRPGAARGPDRRPPDRPPAAAGEAPAAPAPHASRRAGAAQRAADHVHAADLGPRRRRQHAAADDVGRVAALTAPTPTARSAAAQRHRRPRRRGPPARRGEDRAHDGGDPPRPPRRAAPRGRRAHRDRPARRSDEA